MEDIYEQFKKASLEQLNSLTAENISLFHFEPIPESYTIIVKPDINTLEQIVYIQNTMRTIEPDQYYYPVENFHITLLGMIPTDIDIDLITKSIKQMKSRMEFLFRLEGLASNNYASSCNAFPLGFSLYTFRKQLREEIHHVGDDYTTHIPLYEYVGWINYLRYLKKPSEHFLDTIRTYQGMSCGIMKPAQIEFYKTTSRVLDPHVSTRLASIPLL